VMINSLGYSMQEGWLGVLGSNWFKELKQRVRVKSPLTGFGKRRLLSTSPMRLSIRAGAAIRDSRRDRSEDRDREPMSSRASAIVTAIPRAAASDVERLYDKIARRIMPFLVLLFVVAWLDRINVGFARLKMVEDLGFSNAAYGFGAGIFYLGYLLFEIPSNLVLERIGARKTFARITILWGLTSMTMLLVRTAGWFYVLRFLLGAFEAGLLPGAILYLTYWFPTRRRARMTGLFLAAVPIAGVVGGPLSGLIMRSMGGW